MEVDPQNLQKPDKMVRQALVKEHLVPIPRVSWLDFVECESIGVNAGQII